MAKTHNNNFDNLREVHIYNLLAYVDEFLYILTGKHAVILFSSTHSDRKQNVKQRSCSIAKMTARCALYMSASYVSSQSRT